MSHHDAGRATAWFAVTAMASGLVALRARPAFAAPVNPYVEQRAAAVGRCEGISRADYQTGLLMNPDGFRAYYVRSACFQNAAVLFRDRALCDQVRRRWSLFSSSWGYSTGNCRKLVAEGVARDVAAIETARAAYRAGPVRLQEIRLERNGNGRDIDIIPTFGPGYAAGYTLRVELLTAASAVAIDSSGYHLSGGDNIRGFVRQADIRSRVPDFSPGRTYRVRATLILSIGFGGQSGMWSDAFVERRFPLATRSQSIEREVTF